MNKKKSFIVDQDKIAVFCQRNHIRKLSFFGSVLRGDFTVDSDVDVLVELAESVGLDGTEARKVLEERTCEDAVDADWAKSREYGVTGVPTYVAGGSSIVGAQPYEALADLAEQAGAEKK